jgi:hypothetical protein
LDGFLDKAADWPFSERLELTLWIAGQTRLPLFESSLLPQPLMQRVIGPTITEWVELEPSSAEAHHLAARLGGSSNTLFPEKAYHLRRAVALNPAHDQARVALVNWLTSDPWDHQHVVPDGYNGDPESDLRDLLEAEVIAAGIGDHEMRERKLAEVRHFQQIASSWLQFRRTGSEDFRGWCAERGIDLNEPD